MTTPTPTPVPTAEPLANASSSINGGFASSVGVTGPLVIGLYIVGALLAAQFVAPWLAKSRLVSRVSDRVVASVNYAIKGLAATAVLGVLAAPVYLVATSDGQTQGVVLQAIAVLAVAYIALVGIGWLADRAVTAFLNAHPEHDEWSDLFPDTPDEDDLTSPEVGD